MPPLVLLAIAGAGCYAGYKLFAKLVKLAAMPSRAETERVRREARAAAGGVRDLGELEWDEKSGVYKPSASSKG
jgi:hypothetical protein